MTNYEMEQFACQWQEALVGLRIVHPDPAVTVHLGIVPANSDVKVLFVFQDVVDTRSGDRFDLEYYFRASHWPGVHKARLWILAVWALFMEHEALESFRVEGRLLADPHDPAGARLAWGHCAALDKRHDMKYMIARICGVDATSGSD